MITRVKINEIPLGDDIMEWIKVKDKLPHQSEIVETKIHDDIGIRNVQFLKLVGKLWVTSDNKMYVYYIPTHWRQINNFL